MDEAIQDTLRGSIRKKSFRKIQRESIFDLKLIVEELPTLEKLKIRRPDLYKEETLCPRCNKEKEDFLHIWRCTDSKGKMKGLVYQVLEKMEEETSEKGEEVKEKIRKEIKKKKNRLRRSEEEQRYI